MASKTNAQRLLDEAGISYQALEYHYDQATFSAEEVAHQLGLRPGQVFKTLLICGRENGPVFVLVPAGSKLSLKKLALLRGERRTEPVPRAQVHGLTGYQPGAVTVLGSKRAFPVVADLAATEKDQIAISAGVRGIQMMVPAQPYLELVSAQVADLCRPIVEAGRPDRNLGQDPSKGYS